jgi:2,3-bisphosphoglycerate-dependent phosphoglycerate mutase
MTYNTIATELDCHYIPVRKHWRLNERHYGALQGLNKAETAAKHGEEKVLVWRRSYDIPPPELDENDERHPKNDPRYSDLPLDVLPRTESLKLTVDRVLPFWYDEICPAVKDG